MTFSFIVLDTYYGILTDDKQKDGFKHGRF